jgi:hypothetical protein
MRYLTGTLRRLNSRLPGALAANFQAGHANSILVTRSRASLLVKSAFSVPRLFEHPDDRMTGLVMRT